MHISRYWLCLCNMASKRSRTTNFLVQEKLLLAELGGDVPEVGRKDYDSKTLARRQRHGRTF